MCIWKGKEIISNVYEWGVVAFGFFTLHALTAAKVNKSSTRIEIHIVSLAGAEPIFSTMHSPRATQSSGRRLTRPEKKNIKRKRIFTSCHTQRSVFKFNEKSLLWVLEAGGRERTEASDCDGLWQRQLCSGQHMWMMSEDGGSSYSYKDGRGGGFNTHNCSRGQGGPKWFKKAVYRLEKVERSVGDTAFRTKGLRRTVPQSAAAHVPAERFYVSSGKALHHQELWPFVSPDKLNPLHPAELFDMELLKHNLESWWIILFLWHSTATTEVLLANKVSKMSWNDTLHLPHLSLRYLKSCRLNFKRVFCRKISLKVVTKMSRAFWTHFIFIKDFSNPWNLYRNSLRENIFRAAQW